VRLRVFSSAAAIGLAACAAIMASVAVADEPVLQERQQRLFQQACAHCHLRPGLGVPVVGDAAAWEERRAQGFETLLANTVRGVRDMPPLGTCGACSEEDLRRLVAFVAGLPLPAQETAP
jgi:cytochrome c5